MKRNRKQNIRLLVLILILLLGIGFAALAANLKIDGTLNVSRTSWDVHFENVQITNGSVTANPAPTSDDTTTTEMTYTINFTKPGDYFEFTTDIVNDGTIDAMVDVVSNNAYQNVSSTTPITLPTYLTSTVTYADGVEILPNQELLHNTSEKIKVRVEFKKDIQISDLPSSGDTSIVFKFIGDYKQADENATPKPMPPYNPGDLVYFDPVTQINCNENTFDLDAVKSGTSTCYKWRVLTVGDTSSNEKITIQLDHNIVGEYPWVTQADYNDDTNYGTYGNNNKGPISALKKLEEVTSNWTIPGINYTYETTGTTNYGTLLCTNGACTINSSPVTTSLKARLITGEEVKTLTMNEGAAPNSNAGVWTMPSYIDSYWFSSKNYLIGTRDYLSDASGNTNLSWLVENTQYSNESGSTDDIYNQTNTGYWSLTPVTTSGSWYDAAWKAWDVIAIGNYYNFHSVNGDNGGHHIGIRPVIEIEKNKLK